MYKVRFYETERGGRPIEEFLEVLDGHTRQKLLAYIAFLEEMGPSLKRPYADKVSGKIYELRPRRARFFYFFAMGREIVVVHGVMKKDRAIDSSDILLAENRMSDWMRRFQGGRK